jgi:hypothetical protein
MIVARGRCAAAAGPDATLRAIIVNRKTRAAPARRVCVGRMTPLERAGAVALAAADLRASADEIA